MEHIEAKNLVVKAGLELMNSGLVARTWGNVSCRIDETTFAITPSGREYQTLTPDDIVEVKIDDLTFTGNIKPSSEKGIHAAVYQIHPEINFVIHTHQENASAMSATGLDYFRPLSEYSELGRTVVCAKYALPGTKALCKNVTEALKISSGNAIVMKHHGTLCIGKTYEETFLTASQLEAASTAFINEKGGQIQGEPSKDAQPLSEESKDLLDAWNSSGKQGYILINADSDVVRFSKLGISLKPLLDDFAQIVGTKIKTVRNHPNTAFSSLKSVSAVMVKDIGAVCWGIDEHDAEAVSMIVRKNCKSYFASSAMGHAKYIRPWECILMRQVYLKKYSRMSEKNKRGEKE